MSLSVAVIGAGPIGAALSRRLAEGGVRPICFGPTDGPPYSSHDDSGRITRILDASRTWAMLAARAIGDYADIESRSGIRFHHPVGVLWAADSPVPLAALDPVRSEFRVTCETGLGGWDGLAAVTAEAVLERGEAGYITPRNMVRAQRLLAVRHGAVFDQRVVDAIEPVGRRWKVRLRDGGATVVDRVVVAAGAGSRELVDVELEVTAEVVIDAAVTSHVGDRIASLPCLGRLSDSSVVDGYLTPPMRSEAGWSIKFGAERVDPMVLDTEREVADWMSGDAHSERLTALSSALRDLLPGLDFGRMRSRPCIYARTRTGLPIVDEIEPGLVVATGGNGRMAKSADAVAALAVPLVTDGRWGDEQLEQSSFFA